MSTETRRKSKHGLHTDLYVPEVQVHKASDKDETRKRLCTVLSFLNVFEVFWSDVSCSIYYSDPVFVCEENIDREEANITLKTRLDPTCTDSFALLVGWFCLSFNETLQDTSTIFFRNWTAHQTKLSDAPPPTCQRIDFRLLMETEYFHMLISKFTNKSRMLLVSELKHCGAFTLEASAFLKRIENASFFGLHAWNLDETSASAADNNDTTVIVATPVQKQRKCHIGTFQCKISCIPSKYVCDEKVHCPDGRDETNKTCVGMKSLLEKYKLIFPNRIIPSKKVVAELQDEHLKHFHGNITSTMAQNIQKESLVFAPCQLISKTRKRFNRSYPYYTVCIFDRMNKQCESEYMAANLIFCEHHHCPGHFKCTNSYCVPYRTVCDGIYDCPHGEDENTCAHKDLECPSPGIECLLFAPGKLRMCFGFCQENLL